VAAEQTNDVDSVAEARYAQQGDADLDWLAIWCRCRQP
jgi:hypothetical protein